MFLHCALLWAMLHTAAAPAWRLTGAQQSGHGFTHWYAFCFPHQPHCLHWLGTRWKRSNTVCLCVSCSVCVCVCESLNAWSAVLSNRKSCGLTPSDLCLRSEIWFPPFSRLALLCIFNVFYFLIPISTQTHFPLSFSSIHLPSLKNVSFCSILSFPTGTLSHPVINTFISYSLVC